MGNDGPGVAKIDGQSKAICSRDALLAHWFKTVEFIGRGRCNAPIVCFAIRCRFSFAYSLGSASNAPSVIGVSVHPLPRYSSHSALRLGAIRSMCPLRMPPPCSVCLAVAEAGAIGTQNPRGGGKGRYSAGGAHREQYAPMDLCFDPRWHDGCLQARWNKRAHQP